MDTLATPVVVYLVTLVIPEAVFQDTLDIAGIVETLALVDILVILVVVCLGTLAIVEQAHQVTRATVVRGRVASLYLPQPVVGHLLRRVALGH